MSTPTIFDRGVIMVLAMALIGCGGSGNVYYRPGVDPPVGYLETNKMVPCHPLKKTIANESQCAVLHGEKALVLFAIGTGADGFDVTQIHGSGKVTYTYSLRLHNMPFADSWRTAEYSLPPATVERLLCRIEEVGIRRMAKKYTSNVADSAEMVVIVQGEGCEQKCVCAGHYPASMCAIYDAIRENVYSGHAKAMAGRAVKYDDSNRTLGWVGDE